MINSEYLGILVTIVLTTIFGFGIAFSIKHKNLTIIVVSVICFLASLIALFSVLPIRMVDNSILLQIDATIIAGALILLTITSFAGKKPHTDIGTRFIGGKYIPWTPHQVASVVLVFFGTSSCFILISGFGEVFHAIGVGMALIGFGYLILAGFVLGVKELDINNLYIPEHFWIDFANSRHNYYSIINKTSKTSI